MAGPWERIAQRDLTAFAPERENGTAIGFTSGTTGNLKGATFDRIGRVRCSPRVQPRATRRRRFTSIPAVAPQMRRPSYSNS